MPPIDTVRALEFPGLAVFLRQLDRRLLQIARRSQDFNQPIATLVKSGGKRLRPAMVYLTSQSGSTKTAGSVLSAAAAIELTHLASMIHDDVIDQSFKRRGQPTAARRLGEGKAVLTGDFLLSQAFNEANGLGSVAVAELADTIARMARGVSREKTAPAQSGSVDRQYAEIARGKTGALFWLACRLGGRVANLPKDKIACLGLYGETFGVSFQIIDDSTDGVLSKSAVSAARSVRQYNRQAVKQLDKLPPSPALGALRLLPDLYLDSTIGL